MTAPVDDIAYDIGAEALLAEPPPGDELQRFSAAVAGQPWEDVERLVALLERAVSRHGRIDLPTVVHEGLKADLDSGLAVDYRELSTMTAPSPVKTFPGSARYPLPGELVALDHTFDRVLRARASRRDFGGPPVTQAELATVLARSYGVRRTISAYNTRGFPVRVVPTAGGLQSPELYLVVNDVTGLPKGLYHYDAPGHALELLSAGNMRRTLVRMSLRQEWIHHADVVLLLTTVLDRLLWKYGPRCYRYAHMDVGYVSAHVYLVTAALGLRTSAVSGFQDDEVNRFLRLDGSREFAQLLMPIGRRAPSLCGPDDACEPGPRVAS